MGFQSSRWPFLLDFALKYVAGTAHAVNGKSDRERCRSTSEGSIDGVPCAITTPRRRSCSGRRTKGSLRSCTAAAIGRGDGYLIDRRHARHHQQIKTRSTVKRVLAGDIVIEFFQLLSPPFGGIGDITRHVRVTQGLLERGRRYPSVARSNIRHGRGSARRARRFACESRQRSSSRRKTCNNPPRSLPRRTAGASQQGRSRHPHLRR